jgi:hypothetical protein
VQEKVNNNNVCNFLNEIIRNMTTIIFAGDYEKEHGSMGKHITAHGMLDIERGVRSYG